MTQKNDGGQAHPAAWGYPEDVPSGAMRQKGDEYGQTTYRPSWPVIFLALLAWAAVIAVIVLWAGMAQAQTHDSAGRYILRGDPSARPSPHHSGGGITTSAARYFLRIADRGPFRIEGDWFSSGTMVLALVVGPDAVESSCLGNVRFSFHEAIPLTGDNSDLNQNRGYSGVFTRPLRDWYHGMRNGGGMSYWNSMTLTAADLAGFGYPVCGEEQ